MIGFGSKNEEVIYKHLRTVRVAAFFNNDSYSTGTGFFVSDTGKIVTCWHVLFGTDLKLFKLTNEFAQNTEVSEAEKVETQYNNKIVKIEIQKPDGNTTEAKLVGYDYFYDLAILEIPKSEDKIPYFELETQEALDYIDEVNFCGYPECSGYNSLNSPFAVNTGVVSAFPEVDIAGGKYKNIQLNTICIGGNSGAPLFKNGSLKVSGIVNGYQWKGQEKIPINISFATGFDLLKEKSEVFKNL
jgi:S1-C subfamily serine protease